MSCTTIELKRKAVTGLEEIGKKIQEDLSGDFVSSELAVRKITEAEGVRVLLMVFEKYYWRNGSMAVTVVQIMDSGEEQRAVVAGTGGGEGIAGAGGRVRSTRTAACDEESPACGRKEICHAEGRIARR